MPLSSTEEETMCVPFDSLPPIPPLAGAAVSNRLIELESADGTRFAAFSAAPEDPSGVGVVILPDVRGLFRFYEELALRLAEREHAAVAIDYFGRTAGVGERDEDFPYPDHVAQTTPETIQLDVAAAAAWLRSGEGGSSRALFTLGFCFGGRHSWLAAAAGLDLSGAIGFYGMPGERDGRPGPTQRAADLRAPILGLMGGADAAISGEVVTAFEEALDAAGVESDIVTYPGAPHSFFDRKYEEFAGASEDAWVRTLTFIEEHAGLD
jgi:carboxymethylenebutenolidase